MSILGEISRAGLDVEFEQLIGEYLTDDSKYDELKTVIDTGGLRGDTTMVFISKGNRTGVLKPGLYKRLVEFDMAMKENLSRISISDKQPPEETTMEKVSDELVAVDEDSKESYTQPELVSSPEKVKKKKEKKTSKATVEAKSAGGKSPKKSRTDKVKKKSFIKPLDRRVAKVGVQVPLKDIMRPSSMGYKIIGLLMEKSLTISEATDLGTEAGYHSARVLSTLSACSNPKSNWYLPRYGWELREVGEKEGSVVYQVLPLEH